VRRRKVLETLLVAVGSALMACAIGPSASAQSLQEALTQAYRQNPQLDAQRATLRATDESVAQANAGYRPRVTGNADVAYNRTDTRPQTTTGSTDLHPRGFGVTVSQPIFSGFRTLNAVRAAEANVRAGRETLRAVEQTVLLAAATAFVDVVRDQAIVRLSENNVNVLTNQLRATQDQFAVGEVTRTDVAQAEARRAGAVSALEVARANLKTSRATYERIIGSAPGRLTEPPEPRSLLPRTLDDAIQIGVRENPNLGNALYLEQAARAQVDQIRGELLPTVTLDASYARRYDPSRAVDESDATSVTTRVSVPIYTGGEVDARVRAAKHTQVARLQQIEQIRTEQQSLVVSAWSRLLAARAQGVSAAAQVRANSTALTGVREEYRVGQRTLLDVLNAEQELLNSQVSEVTARHDAIVQAYTLVSTIGRLNAQELRIGDALYDAEQHYVETRRKWWGVDITDSKGRREHLDLWDTHGQYHEPAK
jgi:outer membrane protein